MSPMDIFLIDITKGGLQDIQPADESQSLLQDIQAPDETQSLLQAIQAADETQSLIQDIQAADETQSLLQDIKAADESQSLLESQTQSEREGQTQSCLTNDQPTSVTDDISNNVVMTPDGRFIVENTDADNKSVSPDNDDASVCSNANDKVAAVHGEQKMPELQVNVRDQIRRIIYDSFNEPSTGDLKFLHYYENILILF